MRRTWLAILVLLVASWMLSPLVTSIQRQRREFRYGQGGMTRAIRGQIGQGMAIGLLAGFRGVVADFLWIENHGYWESKEWLRMYRNMELVTTLQPQAVTFWDISAWHMAWNVAHAARTDPENLSAAVGIKREREWQDKAREFLAEGIRNNPNRYDLYFSMGWLYWKKLKQPCDAKEYFHIAAGFPDAPSYTLRIYARALEQCGDIRGAYEYWKGLWRGGHPEPFADSINAQLVIGRELRRLEVELNIPPAQRVVREVIQSGPKNDR